MKFKRLGRLFSKKNLSLKAIKPDKYFQSFEATSIKMGDEPKALEPVGMVPWLSELKLGREMWPHPVRPIPMLELGTLTTRVKRP